MKRGFINLILLGIVALAFAGVSLYLKHKLDSLEGNKFGATQLVTQLSDTINAFRTNTNTNFEALFSTTSTDPGFKITTASVSGTIAVSKGGTGTSTHTYGVVIASGTNAFTTITPGTSGNVLQSDGSNWSSVANSPVSVTTSTITATGTFSNGGLLTSYTGASTTWTVPAGVNSITLNLLGAAGNSAGTGLGGSVTGTLAVSSGTVYYLTIGQVGQGSGEAYGGGANGIQGGGGKTTFSATSTYSNSTVLLVAGGGGGGASGGTGGGLTGGNGATGGCGSSAATGGSQTAGGSGGVANATGQAGVAGRGGDSNPVSGSGADGGGGAGYFGGGGSGGSAGSCAQAGAGGGSSFASSTLSATSTASGVNSGSGSITISYMTVTGNNYGGVVTSTSAYTATTIRFFTPFPTAPGCSALTSVTSSITGITTSSTLNLTFDKALPSTSTIMYVCI